MKLAHPAEFECSREGGYHSGAVDIDRHPGLRGWGIGSGYNLVAFLDYYRAIAGRPIYRQCEVVALWIQVNHGIRLSGIRIPHIDVAIGIDPSQSWLGGLGVSSNRIGSGSNTRPDSGVVFPLRFPSCAIHALILILYLLARAHPLC